MSLPNLHALHDQYLLQHIETALQVNHLAAQLAEIEKTAALQTYPASEQQRIREKYERLNILRLEKFRLEQCINQSERDIKKLTILSNFSA